MGIPAWLSKFWNWLFQQPAPVPKLGRNDLCYCGSGKKYKHCHLQSDKEKELQNRFHQQQAQFNRENEPDWSISILDPTESMAQQGLNNAHKLLKKEKGSKE